MSAPAGQASVPRWVSIGLIPLINLMLALIVSGIVVLIIGENPLGRPCALLVHGAFIGYGPFGESIGFTLYYATNFVFTGLCVAMAFHCGLFNIGGEGQAYIGGLGVGLVCLYFDFLPFILILPLAILGGALFGAGWSFMPGYLQAKRGSHTVITTIMFNFIAAALMNYLMVKVLIRRARCRRRAVPSPSIPSCRRCTRSWAGRNQLRTVAAQPVLPVGADLLCLLVWGFIWRTRWGYELRTVGQNQRPPSMAASRSRRTSCWRW